LQQTKLYVAYPGVFPVFMEKRTFHVSLYIKGQMDETSKFGWPVLRHLLPTH